MSVSKVSNVSNVSNVSSAPSTVNAIEETKNLEEFSPNYEFVNTREMTIKDFFNTLFVQFGHYRATQRIPRLDGLNETQRKILWAAIKKKYKNKEKLTDVMSDVNKISNYHHGPASLANVLNNLIAPYKNGLAFLRPDGAFGSRSTRSAAAERYTQTRNNQFLELMFPEEDITATHGYRSIDGKPAEPLTLYPILPLGIINGQSQTSVGFATELLPRDPKVILDLFVGILKGTVTSIPGHLTPKWPLCECNVNLTGPNSWETRGVVKKGNKGKKKFIEILEVPHNWDGSKLVSVLDALQDSGDIESFIDATNGDKFSTIIYSSKFYDLPEETIVEKLGLTSTVKESFVYINMDSRFITDCKTIASYINYFIQERIKIYEARRTYRLAKCIFDLNKTVAVINYINEVIAGRIEIRNKSEEEVIKQLEAYPDTYSFKPMSKTFVYLDPALAAYSKVDLNYDYLFDFTVRNFTPKRIEVLQERWKKIHAEYIAIESKTAAGIWLEDLEEFDKIMLKYGWNK